jgi:hypothetical protein
MVEETDDPLDRRGRFGAAEVVREVSMPVMAGASFKWCMRGGRRQDSK